jgi:hypothetical protein
MSLSDAMTWHNYAMLVEISILVVRLHSKKHANDGAITVVQVLGVFGNKRFKPWFKHRAIWILGYKSFGFVFGDEILEKRLTAECVRSM